jgi:IclR family acetate operon transcriptional repressor
MARVSPPNPADEAHTAEERDTIAALDRAIMILEAVSQAGGGSLQEIAKGLEQPDGIAMRVLKTLEAREIVERDPSLDIWHVGAGAFRIGSAFLPHANLLERSGPTLEQVLETTGETASLSIKSGNTSICIAQLETCAPLRACVPTGSRLPIHASATGKVLLAYSDDQSIQSALNDDMEKLTSRTVIDHTELSSVCARIRTQGFAEDDEERVEGVRSVAAPVFGTQGKPLAALAISGPSTRLTDERIIAHRATIVAAATQLSARLGAS